MSNQIVTFKKKHPSDATRSSRRRSQKRREQSARQQRWTDASAMAKAIISNILNHPEDEVIRDDLKAFCARTDKRAKGKQSDEQIVLKAIRAGCWTVEDIQDETGFTVKFIRELLGELGRAGKVIFKDNLYRAT